MKTCFLMGHREAPQRLLPVLETVIERHILKENVRVFIVGHYGAFDQLATRAVMLNKQKYPEIILLRLLPYHPAERPVDLGGKFDDSWYPEGLETISRRLAILRANQAAVDRADYLITYVCHPASNAGNLMTYARKRGKTITNIGALEQNK